MFWAARHKNNESTLCKNILTNSFRDINAAKNILEDGIRIIGAEVSDNAEGGLKKTAEKKHKPVKYEAHVSFGCG
jgi:hypothetical protein